MPWQRLQAIELINEACKSGARKAKACELLDLSIRTVIRWERQDTFDDKRKTSSRSVPANKLTKDEREMIIKTVNSKKYCDLPPCKIVPLLSDDGIYIASESSFYRVLREAKQLSHRQLCKSPKHHKPKEYVAYAANQVWSWDISYLPSQIKGMYFYLYLVMDVYSRKIVGWSIHETESSERASHLIQQCYLDEGVEKNQIILHSDNGKPMKGATMLAMLEKLGVIPSFSRPSVSDDNPYSESLFRTLKYHPNFPMLDKFAGIQDARVCTEKFVTWYNTTHLHSSLKFVTPQQRHRGEDEMILRNRHAVYEQAKQRHPERWSGKTRNWILPNAVTLNPDKKHKKLVELNDEIIEQAI